MLTRRDAIAPGGPGGATTSTANAQLPIGDYEREEMLRRAMMK